MVYMRLLSDGPDGVSYEYMPESADAPRGVVSLSGGEGRVNSFSPADKHGIYAMHALHGIREMAESDGVFDEETWRAWG